MAETLGIDLGQSILAGLAAGLIPALGVIWAAGWMNARWPIPLREAAGAPLADLQVVLDKRDDELPSFGVSILPVALPVVLIGLASVLGLGGNASGSDLESAIRKGVAFLGNKNVALSIGTCIALWILARQKGLGRDRILEVVGPPLETAGVIILITSAGGAFGAMIKHTDLAASIEGATRGGGVNFIVLAWLIAAVMKIAQGSGTVSMITTAGLMAAILGDGSGLAYHPMYIFLAIGFGSLMISWMNDSGFWVVCKLSGFTEKETLKTWTVLLALISLIGLIEVLLLSRLLPMPMG
jgi:GntP family gluconate:H+ symporter